jgi:hypothetical protein
MIFPNPTLRKYFDNTKQMIFASMSSDKCMVYGPPKVNDFSSLNVSTATKKYKNLISAQLLTDTHQSEGHVNNNHLYIFP